MIIQLKINAEKHIHENPAKNDEVENNKIKPLCELLKIENKNLKLKLEKAQVGIKSKDKDLSHWEADKQKIEEKLKIFQENLQIEKIKVAIKKMMRNMRYLRRKRRPFKDLLLMRESSLE